VISKPKIPYVHRIYMVLANPTIDMQVPSSGRLDFHSICITSMQRCWSIKLWPLSLLCNTSTPHAILCCWSIKLWPFSLLCNTSTPHAMLCCWSSCDLSLCSDFASSNVPTRPLLQIPMHRQAASSRHLKSDSPYLLLKLRALSIQSLCQLLLHHLAGHGCCHALLCVHAVIERKALFE